MTTTTREECYHCELPIDPEMGEVRVGEMAFCSPECATPYDEDDGDYATDQDGNAMKFCARTLLQLCHLRAIVDA